ncbi:carboxypeptidase-like regulatory domain-containing protein [Nostoc sp.]|uniref:carboxypeptidase-like regulatory domain-containing protein n=1 Tax=Nostoc sp. TaxID=1180 RepID=UPI002FF6B6FB
MNYRKWGLVLSILGIGIAAITGIASITIPEVRCFLRLECRDPKLVSVKLLVVTEESKALEGVEVSFISSGSPEIKMTNSDGYVQIKIPSTGDIEIKLSKEGYQTLTRTINIDIEPDKTRTYRLKKIVEPKPTPTITPTEDPSKSSTPDSTLGSSVTPENTCIKKEGYDSEINSQAIIVGRTYQKPKRRIYQKC